MINPEVKQGFERSTETQELWQGQQEAKVAIQEAHDNGITRGYLHMATGTGKTRVVAEDVARTMEAGETERVLYLCHNGEILRQAHNEFEKVLGDSNSHSYMFGGEFEDSGDVVYATFQTMTRKLGGGQAYEAFDPDEFDYIAIDEGHHSAAETYRPVIEYFNPKFLTAMTATPRRRDNQLIEDVVGPELFSLPLERAIAEGYVTPVNYKILTDHVKTLPQLKAEGVKLDINKIDEQVFIPKRDEEIVASIKEELSEIENPKTVVFCSSIAEAEHFAEVYPDEASPIHSRLDDEEVRSRIKRFKNGDISMAVTVGMFDEGIDLPEINSVVFLRQTESETVWLQQLGRGLRKAEGKDEVKVLDYVASFGRLNRIHNLIDNVSSRIIKSTHSKVESSTTSFMKHHEKAPFVFNMSDEAKRCVEIIEIARNKAKTKPAEAEVPDSPEVIDIKRRFGIGENEKKRVDEEFSNLSESEWENIVRKIQLGDTALQRRSLEHFYPTILKLAQSYPEQNGLTVEDYFMAGCMGYWQGLAEGKPTDTTIGSGQYFNTRARNETASLIKDNLLLKKSLNNLTPSTAAEKYRDPVLREERDVTELTLLDESPSIHEEAIEDLQDEAIPRVLAMLSDRDAKVVRMRYGLDTGEQATLDEISMEVGMTRERIRQIEHSGLKQMKRLPETQVFNDFYISPKLKLYRKDGEPNDGLGYYRHLDHTLDKSELHRQNQVVKTKIYDWALSLGAKPKYLGDPFLDKFIIDEKQYAEALRYVVYSILKEEPKTPGDIIQQIEQQIGHKNIVQYSDVRRALIRLSEQDIADYKDKAHEIIKGMHDEMIRERQEAEQRVRQQRADEMYEMF